MRLCKKAYEAVVHVVVILIVIRLGTSSTTKMPVANQPQSSTLQVIEGSQVIMSCSTSRQESVEWRYTPVSTQIPRLVYVRGSFSDSGRFKIDRQNDTKYDLLLVNATEGDSGLYECTEDEGHGKTVESYNLAVLKQLQINPSGHIKKFVGDVISIACITNMNEPIDIYFQTMKPEQHMILFTRNTTINDMDGKVLVSNPRPRQYQIMIKNATESMSGKLECVDDNGLGPGRGDVTVNILDLSSSSSTGDSTTAQGEGSSVAETTSISDSMGISFMSAVIVPPTVTVIVVLVLVLVLIKRRCRTNTDNREVLKMIEVEADLLNDERSKNVPVQADEDLEHRFMDTKDIGADNEEPILLHHKPGHVSSVEGVIASNEDLSGDIGGLTVLHNELFVVRTRPTFDCVEVYNATNFVFQRYIQLHESVSVSYGLASCDFNNCLYVSDMSNVCIHRVELDGNNKVIKWSVKEKPRGLSVNNHHNVVACCSSVLVEYTSRGECVREICLQLDGVHPQHAIQLDSGRFVVSSCLVWGDSLHQVCIFDDGGRLLLSYGNKPGSAAGSFNGPRHVAVDKTERLIYAADLNNNRIVVLVLDNASLEWSRYIDVFIDHPFALCLDERDRLYIGEGNGQQSRVVVVNIVESKVMPK